MTLAPIAVAASVVVIAGVVLLASQQDHRHGDGLTRSDFDNRLRALAGLKAIDCGYVAWKSDQTSAATCFRAAMAAGKPFVVVFESRGIDSLMLHGLAANADRRVWLVRYDDDATGGWRPRIGYLAVDRCSNPTIDSTTSQITCAAPASPTIP